MVDRGQLLLVGAITMAVAILGGVVLLNSIHASPNITAEADSDSLERLGPTEHALEQDLRRFVYGTHPGIGDLDGDGNSDLAMLPFVRDPGINSAVLDGELSRFNNEYSSAYATGSATTVNITYDNSEAIDGAVSYDRELNSLVNIKDGSGNVIGEKTEVIINGSGGQITDFTLEEDEPGPGDFELIFEHGGTESTLDEVLPDPVPDDALEKEFELQIRDGDGLLITTDSEWRFADVLPHDIESIRITKLSGSVSLDYHVALIEGDCPTFTTSKGAHQGRCAGSTPIDLNPTFNVEILGPAVTHSFTVDTFEEVPSTP